MPFKRHAVFSLSVAFGFTWTHPSARAQVYTVQTLANQIPAGDAVLAEAAASTPAGVEIVGLRRFHDGTFERTPVIFSTSTSNMQVMNNPPSDSTQGVISAVGYVPSLGVIEAGQYDKLVGSTLSTHAVTWNGTPNSAVDIHATSNSGQLGGVTDTSIYAVSSSPNGFQAAGKAIVSGYNQAFMWTGATPQSAQVIKLHDDVRMFDSWVNGVYTFNGVAKQVGYSDDRTSGGGFTQPRARVWSGSAASAIDLTPPGFLFGSIQAGNGDGPNEILCGSSGTSLYDVRPTIWMGTSGAYRNLDTTADHPAGTIRYCLQTSGVGNLDLSAYGGSSHAAIWDFASGGVIDLHDLLPPEYQLSGGSSTAFYEDAFGNVYGQATTNGSSVGVPMIWAVSVPEPSSLSLAGALAMFLWARRRASRWQ
ncbi:MAG TPA: PEP-CTERM sorting domain-containing protein [Gemmataceae bacterium]|jgi:hypothetical protein|nr:PEP-CTERM sorting domain-containing protein [Gemmataceae bacterium]